MITPLIAHRATWTPCFSSRIQLKQKYTLQAPQRLSLRFPKCGHAQFRDSSHGHARSAGWSSSEITARLTDCWLVSGRSRVRVSVRPPQELYWLLWNSQGQYRMNRPRPVLPLPIFFFQLNYLVLVNQWKATPFFLWLDWRHRAITVFTTEFEKKCVFCEVQAKNEKKIDRGEHNAT